ncbi:MAG: squalene/phytoene synthase family protein [Ignavibacteriae bacterium]|nr:squalene/phytoene synthase family protein [Ignavibacteriota bacterium]
MSDAINIVNDSAQQIVKKSKTNFMYSTIFIGPEKQEALKVIYSFCRHSDDIVDDEQSDFDTKKINLDNWRNEFLNSLKGISKIKILLDLKDVIDKYKIHQDIFLDLLKGMEMDLLKNRYGNSDELKTYCFYAASTVGLMTIEVFGYKDKAIKEYAVNLGIALQLTNILRDVKKDASKGRIYIPLDDLERFGCTEKDILESRYSSNFADLMKYECEIARSYYKKADAFLVKSEKGRMLSARIMEHIYFRLLKKIEKSDYNVFEKRIRISKFRKIFLAYGVFLKYKLLHS